MLRPIVTDFRNKPRFRSCSGRTSVLSKELWKDFTQKNPEYKGLTWKTYKSIILESNKEIYKSVLSNRDGFEFPKLLGFLFIATCKKPKRRAVDFKKSLELGVIIYHKNWDTDGKIPKIFYTNYGTKYKMENRELWQFTPTREFRNAVSAIYKDMYNRFIEISGITKVWKFFKKDKNG
jgi:hypothetical protein